MSKEDVIKIWEERHAKGGVLLENIKDHLSDLEELLSKVSGHSYEDRMYRFYHKHSSLKVYWLQEHTEEMMKILAEMSPHIKEDDEYRHNPFCQDFNDICNEGTGWEHIMRHNRKWSMITRPIVEAFMHCKYFIEMAVKYGKELEEAPNSLPSGWAALLELYKIR